MAAQQNHAIAQNELALIYYQKNYFDKAITYFTLVANQKLVEAQFNLGSLY